jgi:hypothetical protein
MMQKRFNKSRSDINCDIEKCGARVFKPVERMKVDVIGDRSIERVPCNQPPAGRPGRDVRPSFHSVRESSRMTLQLVFACAPTVLWHNWGPQNEFSLLPQRCKKS